MLSIAEISSQFIPAPPSKTQVLLPSFTDKGNRCRMKGLVVGQQLLKKKKKKQTGVRFKWQSAFPAGTMGFHYKCRLVLRQMF